MVDRLVQSNSLASAIPRVRIAIAQAQCIRIIRIRDIWEVDLLSKRESEGKSGGAGESFVSGQI